MDPSLAQIVTLCSSAQQSIDALEAELVAARAELAAAPKFTASGLESFATWIQAGTTGNKGGGDPSAPKQGVMTPGLQATFATTGKNPYWYLRLADPYPESLDCTHFTYSMRSQFPTAADLAACQALEFECQLHLGTEVWNMAWQAPLKEYKVWRTFDYTKKLWLVTTPTIPVDFAALAPGQWLDIVAEYKIDRAAHTVTHIALTLNGVRHDVSVERPSTTVTNSANAFNAAYQLDTVGALTPYKTIVDKMKVTGS